MAWYRCKECGHMFESGEEYVDDETNATECPMCHGDFERVYYCRNCGEYFAEDECEVTARGNVCRKCIDSYRDDAKAIKLFSDGCDANIELNVFLAEQFTREEIEEILLNELLKRKGADYKDFIDEDRFWFAEQIAQQ